MVRPRSTEQRLVEHVDRLGEEHPPIDLATVDFTVHRPELLADRYGVVLDYMARVELEVDRNVLELTTLLPDPPEVDRYFYADVWQPQEIRHGQILDRLQVQLGREPADTVLDSVSAKIKILGALAHLDKFQDIVRMLYYLTGMSTERSEVRAYNSQHCGVVELGEKAVADTVVAPIRRQEPGHYAFYKMSARGLAEQLSGWQRWLVRTMRRVHFAPVGANSAQQRADFGDLIKALEIDRDLEAFARHLSRAERELLWAKDSGMRVPEYVVAAFREAVELAEARALSAVPTRDLAPQPPTGG